MVLGGCVHKADFSFVYTAMLTKPPKPICKWSVVNKAEKCLQVSLNLLYNFQKRRNMLVSRFFQSTSIIHIQLESTFMIHCFKL